MNIEKKLGSFENFTKILVLFLCYITGSSQQNDSLTCFSVFSLAVFVFIKIFLDRIFINLGQKNKFNYGPIRVIYEISRPDSDRETSVL